MSESGTSLINWQPDRKRVADFGPPFFYAKIDLTNMNGAILENC